MAEITYSTTLIKQCAWCEKYLGFPSRILSLLKQPYMITHGICWDCQKEQLALLTKKAGMHYEAKNQSQSKVQVEKIAW